MLIVFKIHKYHLLCLPDPDVPNDQSTLRRIKMNYDLRGHRIKTKWFARFWSTCVNENLGMHGENDDTYAILGKKS